MAGFTTQPIKKRCLEDDDDSTTQPRTQLKRSKLMGCSDTIACPSDSSNCDTGYCSDKGDSQGNDAVEPQPLTHRSRSPTNQQFEDETSSSGESESPMSSACSSSSSPSSSSSSSGGESEPEVSDIADRSGASDIISVPPRPPLFKPTIRRLNGSTLRSRLASFLPELRAANEVLEKKMATENVAGVELDCSDDREVDGQYIEMNLGLGVLEEQGNDADSDADTYNETTISYDEDESTQSASIPHPKPQQNTSVMNVLMGNKPENQRPTIEEVPP
ncbi:hypothetical protein I7I48_11382 [Histoplasma ohiense]|nr:hypothetical protein I7I48_11382 [Histoplasma ohiense (nom. inval.)]